MSQPSSSRGTLASAGADQHESRLLAQVAAGDRRAFDQLFFAYYPRVLRFCMRMVSSQSIAEELVNDVMLVIWNKAGSFAGNSRVSTWVFGIAYRISLKSLRKQRMLRLFVNDTRALEMSSNDGGHARLDGEDWLTKGFQSLSPAQRAVVELSYYCGHGYAEIARIVKCPENTVKSRMYHARKILRRVMPALAATGESFERGDNERT